MKKKETNKKLKDILREIVIEQGTREYSGTDWVGTMFTKINNLELDSQTKQDEEK